MGGMGVPKIFAAMMLLLLPSWVSDTLQFAKNLPTQRAFWVGLFPSAVLFIYLLRLRGYPSGPVSISLPFSLGNRTYDTTPRDRIAAWKLYVHLSTRKAALPFDEKHDVIA